MKKYLSSFFLVAICLLLGLTSLASAQNSPLARATHSGRLVKVSSVEELMRAINSDVVIELQPGFYNLSQWLEKNQSTFNWSTSPLSCDESFENDIVISNVRNLRIVAAKPLLPTQIVVTSERAKVLSFDNCRGISLQGLIVGHALKAGFCTGGVLSFNKCKDIEFKNLELYGCGTYGIEARDCANLKMDDSWIHDCTYGIFDLRDCDNFSFTNSFFTFCREFTLLELNNCKLQFKKCYFSSNSGEFLSRNSNNHLRFEDCAFTQSEYDSLQKAASAIEQDLVIVDCRLQQ